MSSAGEQIISHDSRNLSCFLEMCCILKVRFFQWETFSYLLLCNDNWLTRTSNCILTAYILNSKREFRFVLFLQQDLKPPKSQNKRGSIISLSFGSSKPDHRGREDLTIPFSFYIGLRLFHLFGELCIQWGNRSLYSLLWRHNVMWHW